MKKLYDYFKDILKEKSIRFVFILSLIYSLLFNLVHYTIYYQNDYLVMVKAFLVSLIMIFTLFLLIATHRIIFFVFFLIFCFFGAAGVYFQFFYKVLINQNAVAVVFETTSEEASGITGLPFVLWLVFITLTSIAVAVFVYKKKIAVQLKKLSLIFLLVPLFFLVFYIFAPTYYFFRFLPMPYSFFQSTFFYFNQKKSLADSIKNKLDISSQPISYKNQKLTAVLIIGESTRADHFHINGYERQTSPLIEKINAISYPNFLSAGTITRVAVPIMLSRATMSQPEIAEKETSLISVFKKAGFYTSWISNQGYLGSTETPVSIIAKESDSVIFNNRSGDFGRMKIYDEELIPHLDSALSGKEQNQLVILHSMGSHWKYDSHYPESFKKFAPTCEKNTQSFCEKEEVKNSYDNSMLYADYFIYKVSEVLKNRNAIVIYVSDHGESIGEGGLYSHWIDNLNVPEQRRVPFIVWSSEKYKSVNQAKYRAIQKNQKKWSEPLKKEDLLSMEKNLSHENIFHSLLDCAGIETQVIEKNRSICSEQLLK